MVRSTTWGEGNQRLRRFDPDAGTHHDVLPPELVEEGWLFEPKLSPDGRRVAVFWNRISQTAREIRGLYVIDTDDGSSRLIALGAVWPLGWAPDGRELFGYDDRRARWLRLRASDGAVLEADSLPVEPRSDGPPIGDADPTGTWFVLLTASTWRDVWTITNFDPAARR
jgi:hypothetical protein